jgi:sigma-54 dependent transcriptional regulator, acetoin dehydrogenase operon transcriptional activator AcoR
MYLGQMKETVEMFAAAISKVLDVDVMIVDNELNRVGNTFRYPDKPIPIRRMSIIGKVISSGELMTIDDKTNYYVCKNCPDISECEITGFIGVPIFFHKEVVGAIALIVPNRNTNTLYKNFRNSKDFLEKMADLLSSKIQNIYDYNNLNLVKKEREIIMDSMEDALLSIDELGYITYHNTKFTDCFHVESNLIGSNLSEVFEHPVMKECFEKRTDVSNKLIYAEYKGKAFYGFLSATSIVIGGFFKGMLFIFKSLNKYNHAINNLTNKTNATFKQFSETSSEKLKRTLAEAKRLAVSNHIILIQSKENCAEELLAQSIHNFSSRSENCFLKVDCSCLAMNTLEKEIFGYENAPDMSDRMGKIMLSHKGTLYFHQINKLSLFLQQRITSFIKTKMISQSNTAELEVDTRLIFFTSEPLMGLVECGKFDEELYYWIGSKVLTLPSLQEREEDLPTLIRQHLEFFSKQFNSPVPILNSELMSQLCSYDWPNNLKELEQVTEQIVFHSKGGIVTTADVPYLLLDFSPKEVKSMEDMEREYIASMLKSKKSKEEIAKLLNISRGTLYRKIKKYDLT